MRGLGTWCLTGLLASVGLAQEPDQVSPAMDDSRDDNFGRKYTYCFRIQESFDSMHWVKTYPTKNSRIYHLHKMLEKRGAKNVQKSVYFPFKRTTTEQNIMLVNPCPEAVAHITKNNQDEVTGVNMHHMEHCPDPMQIISQDTRPLQYQMSLQFAFEWDDGKKFNRGKANILKDLGFNKLEIEKLKRTDGHTDECHQVEYWRRGNLRIMDEEDYDFHSMSSDGDFVMAANAMNEMMAETGEMWMDPEMIPRVHEDLVHHLNHGCPLSRSTSIYDMSFDCDHLSFDANECRGDPGHCRYVFEHCIGDEHHGQHDDHFATDAPYAADEPYEFTWDEFYTHCSAFAEYEEVYEILNGLVTATMEESGLANDLVQTAMMQFDQIVAFITEQVPEMAPLVATLGESDEDLEEGIQMIYARVRDIFPHVISAACNAAGSIDDLQLFANIMQDPSFDTFGSIMDNMEFATGMVQSLIPMLSVIPMPGTDMGNPMEIIGMLMEVLMPIIDDVIRAATGEGFEEFDFAGLIGQVTEALGPLLQGELGDELGGALGGIEGIIGPIMGLIEGAAGADEIINAIITPVLGLIPFADFGLDLDSFMPQVMEMINRLMAVTPEELMTVTFILDTMEHAKNIVMTIVGSFVDEGMLMYVHHYIDSIMNMLRAMELDRVIGDFYETTMYDMYGWAWLGWLDRFMSHAIPVVFNFLADIDVYYGDIPELTADSLTQQVSAQLQGQMEIQEWFASLDWESDDVEMTIAFGIIDHVIMELDGQLTAMEINMVEMLAYYIPFARWMLMEEYRNFEQIIPAELATPMRDILGEDVMQGIVRLGFQIASSSLMMPGPMDFDWMAMMVDRDEFPYLNFLFRMLQVAVFGDLENMEMEMGNFIRENLWIFHATDIPADLEFGEDAMQLFRLWHYDNFTLVEEGRLSAFLHLAAMGWDEKVEDIIWSVQHADELLEMYRIRLNMMGFDASLIDGRVETLYETMASEDLVHMLFEEHDDIAKWLAMRMDHPYCRRTMELFDLDVHQMYMSMKEEEDWLAMYRNLSRVYEFNNVRIQDFVQMLEDCNWLWIDAVESDNPFDYFQGLLADGYGFPYTYTIEEGGISEAMATAFGLTDEKLFMTYANTTGMMHMLAEQSEGLLTAGDWYATALLQDQFVQLWQMRMDAFGLSDTPLTNEALLALGDGPFGKTWEEVILDNYWVFTGHACDKYSERTNQIIREMGLDADSLCNYKQNWLNNQGADMLVPIQTLRDELSPEISMEAFWTMIMSADMMWEKYEPVSAEFESFLLYALSVWELYAFYMPKDDAALLILDLWGTVDWEEPWKDTWGFLTRLATEWGVPVEHVVMGFEYRNELLDMYRSRLSAYGMDGHLVDQGREALMRAVGNDYGAYAMLLEDGDMSETYGWMMMWNENQINALQAFGLNFTEILFILSDNNPEFHSPVNAIHFYNYMADNDPFVSLKNIVEIVTAADSIWMEFQNSDHGEITFRDFAIYYTEMHADHGHDEHHDADDLDDDHVWEFPEDSIWLWQWFAIENIEQAWTDPPAFAERMMSELDMSSRVLHEMVEHRDAYRYYVYTKLSVYGFDPNLAYGAMEDLWMVVSQRAESPFWGGVTYEKIINGPEEDKVALVEFVESLIPELHLLFAGLTGVSYDELVGYAYTYEDVFETMSAMYQRLGETLTQDSCFNADLVHYVIANSAELWMSYPDQGNPMGYVDYLKGYFGCSTEAAVASAEDAMNDTG